MAAHRLGYDSTSRICSGNGVKFSKCANKHEHIYKHLFDWFFLMLFLFIWIDGREN